VWYSNIFLGALAHRYDLDIINRDLNRDRSLIKIIGRIYDGEFKKKIYKESYK
jgi:hypothetical protein